MTELRFQVQVQGAGAQLRGLGKPRTFMGHVMQLWYHAARLQLLQRQIHRMSRNMRRKKDKQLYDDLWDAGIWLTTTTHVDT